ncbi:SDR family oxidoreductase [Hoeflea sp. TYP-13]|uniref:SDR family oxidoreductase n=1 Tax=Hoeflea sp. TYP-13 TaxID=3230023 RepID=UPI0034C66D61
MDLGIAGKTALVLGASQGIGRAIAETLAEEGANVVLAARSADALQDIASSLTEKHGITATPVAVDLTDPGAVEALCTRISEEFKPDMLVNNAGGPPPSPSTGVSTEVWQSSTQMMLFSIVRITEAALGAMKERGWGRIVAIGSSGVVQPIPNLAVSNTIRGAVAGFCKSLSAEVAADGITVNMILPGKIDTARLGRLDAARAEREGKTVEAVRTEAQAVLPIKRYGQPEEFAKVAVFLLSDAAGYVTGQITRVDGGMIRSI